MVRAELGLVTVPSCGLCNDEVYIVAGIQGDESHLGRYSPRLRNLDAILSDVLFKLAHLAGGFQQRNRHSIRGMGSGPLHIPRKSFNSLDTGEYQQRQTAGQVRPGRFIVDSQTNHSPDSPIYLESRQSNYLWEIRFLHDAQ